MNRVPSFLDKYSNIVRTVNGKLWNNALVDYNSHTEEQLNAFEKLKVLLAVPLILALPQLGRKDLFKCHVSASGGGSVLL